MVKIIVKDELKKCNHGVYMITFSNGRFYIGSSRDIKNRIKTHILSIKHNFKNTSTCISLRCMEGFEGDAVFSLIEEYKPINGKFSRYYDAHPLILIELGYISKYKNNKLILNNANNTGNKHSISAYIDKNIYYRFKKYCSDNNISMGMKLEQLIESELP
jgi:predicted GIY-YIG superfamily endonuclease